MLSKIQFSRRRNKREPKNKDKMFSPAHLIKKEEKCEKFITEKI